MHAWEGHRRTPLVRFALHSPDTLLSSDTEVAYFWDARSWKMRERMVSPAWQSGHWWPRAENPERDRQVSLEKRL